MLKVLVSGCLNGPRIRFNETNVELVSPVWERWRAEGRLVSLCPELAAGFSVPRAPAEIVDSTAELVLRGEGRVMEDNGTEVTDMFVAGARLAVELATEEGCAIAVLTDGSPSCGSSYVYDGSFEGGTVPGRGVVAQLLADRGVTVFSEHQLHEADRFLRQLETS